MSDLNMQSPLVEMTVNEGISVEGSGITLSELPILEHFNLRLQPDDPVLLDQVLRSLGISIIQQPNSFIIHDNVLCAWLGPDEWLLIVPLDRADRLEDEMTSILANRFATLVKLGSGQTVFRVKGHKAAKFLSRGIAIDLEDPGFAAGSCAQTVIAHVNVLVLNHSRDEPTFDLVVRRSYADHLWRWLSDVSQEVEFRA